MAEALVHAGATVWHSVPSTLSLVDVDMPALRVLNVGGEAVPDDLVLRWSRPGRRIINTYGPTETTVAATWAELTAGVPVTIGCPLPGYTAFIVDADLRPVVPGEEGELLIGGPGVSPGYVSRDDLTSVQFVTPEFAHDSGGAHYRTGDLVRLNASGEIEFLGRLDTQVKIRGFRVELLEIEAVIVEDPSVAQAVVQCFSGPEGDAFLAAFVLGRDGRDVDMAAIQARVRERLPHYMRPVAFEQLDALPTLPASGKVDRRSLRPPARRLDAGRPVIAAEDAVEERLLEVWSKVLGSPVVSVEDHLFEDLGAHSLTAARLVSAMRREPGFAGLSLRDVYAAPTVRALARQIAMSPAPTEQAGAGFHSTPARTRWLCQLGQAIALVPIFGLAGLQFFFPYLVYVAFGDDVGRSTALVLSGLSFIVIPPVFMAISILVKWVVIGRYRAGAYPLWGQYYFRWWLVRRLSGALVTPYLTGTPLLGTYYRLLGAHIGRRVFLGRVSFDAADLIRIEDDAVISDEAQLATTSIERGLLLIGPATIGRRAHVGTRSVVGRSSVLHDDAELADLSALPTGAQIPAGEVWDGSPATSRGLAPARIDHDPVSRTRSLAVTAGLFIGSLLLPVMAVLPIAPGLAFLMKVDTSAEQFGWDLTWLAYAPVLALSYVLLMLAMSVVIKRTLLPRVQPGTYRLASWFYVRLWFVQQVNDIALRLVHPIYSTLYVVPWYRALGARVGRRAEVSTMAAAVPDLVDIGAESFVADIALVAAWRVDGGRLLLAPTTLGRRAFVGNAAVIPAGMDIGAHALVGVLSKPPHDGGATAPGSAWFGSPPMSLPNREAATGFDDARRYAPPRSLVIARLVVEAVRIVLSLSVFIALFGLVLVAADAIDEATPGRWDVMLLFPLLSLGFAAGCGAFVIALKWALIGRYRPTTRPLWSWFVWRSEFVTVTYENLAVVNFLEPLRGTPWLPAYLRLLGARIGRRACMDSTVMTEFDLIDLGDDVALNESAELQTHLFEDRVMKVGRVSVRDRASIGTHAFVLYDAVVGEDVVLGDLSVVMKGESLPPGTAWEGSPARLAVGG